MTGANNNNRLNSLRLTNPWPSNSRSKWNLEMLIFEDESRRNRRKTLGARIASEFQGAFKMVKPTSNNNFLTLRNFLSITSPHSKIQRALCNTQFKSGYN